MDDKVRLKPTLRKLHFLIGAVAKGENNTLELVLRWDNDMVLRKLKAKCYECFWNDFEVGPYMKTKKGKLKDFDTLKEMFEKLMVVQENALAEILSDFMEESQADG
jgi:hypothetical protein